MILSPLAPAELVAALDALRGALAGWHRTVFLLIADPRCAERAHGAVAERHRQAAITVARRFGMGILAAPPALDFSWDGAWLRVDTEAYVLLHEVAHFQLAAPERRQLVDFGLGAGPETSARAEADAAQRLFGLAREREEAMASLLGILWECALGQPALASFLDQNWLEGAGRPGTAAHFAATLDRLLDGGFIDRCGRPQYRVRPPARPAPERAPV